MTSTLLKVIWGEDPVNLRWNCPSDIFKGFLCPRHWDRCWPIKNYFQNKILQNPCIHPGRAVIAHKRPFCFMFFFSPSFSRGPPWSFNTVSGCLALSRNDVSTAGLINSWMCSKCSLLWRTAGMHPQRTQVHIIMWTYKRDSTNDFM